MTEMWFSVGYKLGEHNRWELRLHVEHMGSRGSAGGSQRLFCVVHFGAPSCSSCSQQCWHCSEADEAGLQCKTSRVWGKIKSRRLGLFYSGMILVQHLLDAGGRGEMVGNKKREGQHSSNEISDEVIVIFGRLL